MANKKTPKRNKKSSKKRNYKFIAIAVVVILVAALAYFGVQYTKKDASSKEIAATVNDEEITMNDLNLKYDRLPEQYYSLISKEMFLDQMINVILLIQEAEDEGITSDDDEVEEELEAIKGKFTSEEEFNAFLGENGLSQEEFREQTKDQLLINNLLDETIYSKIEITEDQIESFYEQNKDMINLTELSGDLEGQIGDLLFKEAADRAIETYLTQLRANAEIIYGEKEKTVLNEFFDTESRVCKEEGKPVVIFFSTQKCSSCSWIETAFNDVIDYYESQGKIIAYHWELDTGDNLRTEEKEEGIPAETLKSFKKYNEKNTVPSFVFGCKYVRLGNSGSKNLEIEEDEFIKAIEKIIQ